jgi:hypothetical protein
MALPCSFSPQKVDKKEKAVALLVLVGKERGIKDDHHLSNEFH